MHAQLLAQEDWVLCYTEGADHSFLEPGHTQYYLVRVIPPLAEQAKGRSYVDDTRLVGGHSSWDVMLAAGDQMGLNMSEKWVPLQ